MKVFLEMNEEFAISRLHEGITGIFCKGNAFVEVLNLIPKNIKNLVLIGSVVLAFGSYS